MRVLYRPWIVLLCTGREPLRRPLTIPDQSSRDKTFREDTVCSGKKTEIPTTAPAQDNNNNNFSDSEWHLPIYEPHHPQRGFCSVAGTLAYPLHCCNLTISQNGFEWTGRAFSIFHATGPKSFFIAQNEMR